MPSDLEGSGGRLIAYPDRKQYCALIDEAVQNGARQQLACELVGIASRTYQRWNQGEALSSVVLPDCLSARHPQFQQKSTTILCA